MRLAKTDEYIASFGPNVREVVERGLSDAGHLQPNKIYLVYYDGTSTYACGGGSYPPTLIGQAQVLYLRGLPDGPVTCASNTVGALGATAPVYSDIAMLHQFGHGLGLVPRVRAGSALRRAFVRRGERPDVDRRPALERRQCQA